MKFNPIMDYDWWSLCIPDEKVDGFSQHFALVSRRQASQRISDLPRAAKIELMELITTLEEQYEMKSYGVAMRCGEGRLICHIYVPDGKGGTFRFNLTGERNDL